MLKLLRLLIKVQGRLRLGGICKIKAFSGFFTLDKSISTVTHFNNYSMYSVNIF